MPGKRSPSSSPLTEAAQAFADELTSYLHLSEAFQRAPLTSSRHLERVNELLGQIAASEQNLAACGQQLASAVSGAREQQEQQAQQTIARIPEIKARMEHLRSLLSQFEGLGGEAAALNQTAVTLGRPTTGADGPSGGGQIGGARELAGRMLELSQKAHELSGSAKQADFEELAAKAHALHQQLLSAHNKLKLAVVG